MRRAAQNTDCRGTIVEYLDKHLVDADARKEVQRLTEMRAEYSASEDGFVHLVEAGNFAGAKAKLLNETRPIQLEYLKGIDAILDGQKQSSVKQGAQAEATYKAALTMLLVLSGLALTVSGVMSVLISRSITKQLGGEPSDLVQAATAIAAGDLTARIDASRAGEGSAVRAMEAMQQSLVQVVDRVRQSSDSIATGSAQIATGNADLSQRTEEQASNLEQTAASMEQMNATVKNNADTARQAAQLATTASAAAEQGGKVVDQVVTTMSDSSASSKKIADIIGVSDGIAFQTNILALNAQLKLRVPASRGGASPWSPARCATWRSAALARPRRSSR